MRRVVRNLQGKAPKMMLLPGSAHSRGAQSHPSDAASMDRSHLGIATDLGSRTSHTAIMARSLTIPSAVGLHDVTEQVESGTMALLDGYTGLLIVNPSPETRSITMARLRSGNRKFRKNWRNCASDRPRPVMANTLFRRPTLSCPTMSLQRIGPWRRGNRLYRTEFLYLDRDSLPGEEEQHQTYRRVAESVRAAPIDYSNLRSRWR